VQAIDERDQLKRLRSEYKQAMLEGRWHEALEHCDSLLDIPSLYFDVNRARVILDKFQAAHRLGDLSHARRLAKVVLEIGQELKTPSLVGRAHLSMAHVLWDTTSTAEAAEHLNQAEAAFVSIGDEVGLARVKRLRNYILYRAGIFIDPQEELLQALQVFEQNNLDAEAADVWNVLSRIARTNPRNPDRVQAREYAEKGLEKAKSCGDSYRIAECYLSLAILSFVEQKYHQVLEYYEKGSAQLKSETHLLLSVYHGIRGAAFLQLGLAAEPLERNRYLEQAFDSLVLELVESAKAKPASLIRALGLLYEFFMRLSADEAQTYAQWVKDTWQRHQMERDFPIVGQVCDNIVRYYPFVNTGLAQ